MQWLVYVAKIMDISNAVWWEGDTCLRLNNNSENLTGYLFAEVTIRSHGTKLMVPWPFSPYAVLYPP